MTTKPERRGHPHGMSVTFLNQTTRPLVISDPHRTFEQALPGHASVHFEDGGALYSVLNAPTDLTLTVHDAPGQRTILIDLEAFDAAAHP